MRVIHLLCGLNALSSYEIYDFHYIIVICGHFLSPYETISLKGRIVHIYISNTWNVISTYKSLNWIIVGEKDLFPNFLQIMFSSNEFLDMDVIFNILILLFILVICWDNCNVLINIMLMYGPEFDVCSTFYESKVQLGKIEFKKLNPDIPIWE